MALKICLVALLALYSFAPSVSGEDCIAASVLNLRISASANLSWEISANEPCLIDEFQVDIVGDRDDEYHFKVRLPYVDLSFLEICEEWTFTVTPISDDVIGYERRLVDYIPLPPFADISLRSFTVTEINERDVFLEWDLTNYTHGDCTLRYRVTIEDESTGDIQDIYVTDRSVHLHLLSPCVQYHLGVRAVNRAHPTIEGPMRYHNYEMDPLPEDPPRLVDVQIGATSANMTWRLENAGRNRCPIRQLFVDAGNHFNISIPLTDSADRPPVLVNLQGLRPNSMYYILVSVENSGGISNPARVGIQTAELDPGKL